MAAVAILLLCGCGTSRTIKAYPGPELPSEELATVTVATPNIFSVSERHGLYLVAVDGVVVKEKPLIRERIVTALVKPGQHSVTLGYSDGSSYSTTPATIVFDAVAGITYEVHAADQASFGGKVLQTFTRRGEWKTWVTERPSGRVVATGAETGRFELKAPDYYPPPTSH